MRWLFAALLVLQAHFVASYLVPLDREAQGTFGGLLRWAWPWSVGDGGLLGRIPAVYFAGRYQRKRGTPRRAVRVEPPCSPTA